MHFAEADHRRPTFQTDSVPILMADGQEWFFPKPYIDIFPRIENGRVVGSDSETHLGPEFDRLVKAVTEGEGGVRFDDYFALAAWLLDQNYELPDAALAVLLRHRKGDEASVERMNAIVDVALGNGPKVSPAGASSPS